MTGGDELTTAVRAWLADSVTLPTTAGIERVGWRVRRTPQRRRRLLRASGWPRLLVPVTTIAVGTAALVGSTLLTGAPATPTLTTVEAEPGVERVVNDGARDVSLVGLARGRDLTITPDGSVWLSTSAVHAIWQSPTPQEVWEAPTLYKLGDAGSYLEGAVAHDDLWVLGDASLQALSGAAYVPVDDGDGWSLVAVPDPIQGTGAPLSTRRKWDIGPDGAVWGAAWADGRAGVARLDSMGWTVHRIDLDIQGLVDFSAEAARAQLQSAPGSPRVESLTVDAAGYVWIGLAVADFSTAPMVLLRFDGETWSIVDPLGAGRYFNVDLLEVGADDTMWLYLETGSTSDDARPHLARLAGGRWTVFTPEDGVVRLVWRHDSRGLLRVDGHGAAWVVPQEAGDQCQGVRAFDGAAWRQYLSGTCVLDLEVAPDGHVWVATGPPYPFEEGEGRHDIYRIDPSVPQRTP